MEYRQIKPEELKLILENHKKWLNGYGGERADLRSADLRSADLRSADLSFADLRFADLSFADLRSADLRSADLSFADLSFADLRSADLSSADLRSADLRSADLSSADLSSADLSSADLLIFQYQRHTAYFTTDGGLRIGCLLLPISEWAETFQEIGKQNGYSDIEIKLYGQFINMCFDKFKGES